MRTFHPVPLHSIPIGVSLPFPIYLKVAGQYVKFRETNDEITNERMITLTAKTDVIYIAEDAWVQFLDYLENICDLEIKDPEKVAENIHSLLIAYGRHIENMKIMDRKTIEKIRKIGYRLADFCLNSNKISSKLLQKFKDTSIYFAGHSSNVAVYSVMIGKKLGMNQNDLRNLSFACLVHNIGNSLISDKLLYKNGKFTDEEWKQVRAHAYQGAQLLQYLDAPTEVVLTARQHHEHMDGRGYPLSLTDRDIHLFAKICSIADVYDALTSKKPYGLPPMEPTDALLEMGSMGGKFDPQILGLVGTA